MARVRTNFTTGLVENNPLASGGTTLNSTGLSSLAAVSSPDVAIIVLDPEARSGAPEVVYVTAHASSATTATILRAQEGTTARQHILGTRWIHAPVKLDFDHGNLDGLTDDDHTMYSLASGARTISGDQTFSRSATTDRSLNVKISTDTQSRLEVYGDGKHVWGAGGTTAPDTNLYRAAADSLKTDDNMTIGGGTLFIGADCSIYRSGADAIQTDDSFRVNNTLRVDNQATFAGTTTSSTAVAIKATADSIDRYTIDAGGTMRWGSGVSAADVNLYRSGIDTLRTDDTLVTARLDVVTASGTNTYAYPPVGSITAYAGSTAPTGWLLCSGANVSRTTYNALWLLIGTTYGAGDGTSTFGLPDLRGRVVVALDNMGGTDAARLSVSNTLGGSGGAQTHTLTTTEIPKHTHSFSVWQGIARGIYDGYSPDDQLSANVSKTVTTSDGGLGSGAHNNMQPYILLNYIIKY